MEDEGRTGRVQEVSMTHREPYLSGTGALLVAVLWSTWLVFSVYLIVLSQ